MHHSHRAYGSEVAAPVQFLRTSETTMWIKQPWAPFSLRLQRMVLLLGTSIARVEAGTLSCELEYEQRYPLLGALFVSSTIFNLGRSLNPEAAILITGLAASTILGLVYLTPIAFITQRVLKRRITARTILYVSILGIALALMGTLTHGSIDIVENLTAIIVLETILLAPTYWSEA